MPSQAVGHSAGVEAAADGAPTGAAAWLEPRVPDSRSSLEDVLGEQMELLGRVMKAKPFVDRSADLQDVIARSNTELRRAMQKPELRLAFEERQRQREEQEGGGSDQDVDSRSCVGHHDTTNKGADDASIASGSAEVLPSYANADKKKDTGIVDPTSSYQTGNAEEMYRGGVVFANKDDGVRRMIRGQPKQRIRDKGQSCLFRMVDNPRFDLFFGVVIVVNTIIMVLEEQFQGSQVGYRIKFYSEYGSQDTIVQRNVFDVLEWIFAFVFGVEVCLRIAGFGTRYWTRPSEYFDLAVVLASFASLLAEGFIPVNVQLAKLLRLAKLMRLVRLIRTIEGFDALHLMTTALKYSVWALCWSVLMLIIMQTFVALVLNTVFRAFYLGTESWLPLPDQLLLFEYFGSYTRTMCSLFEIALANWPPICRFLMENLSEGWMVFVIMYKIVMGVAVIGVINAVFMQETMKVASTDDMMMVRTKARAAATHKHKMRELFNFADDDRDGALKREELEQVLQDTSIRTWLASMEIDIDRPELLFELLYGEKEAVTFDELVVGISSLKGPSRAVDMRHLMKKVDGIARAASHDSLHPARMSRARSRSIVEGALAHTEGG